MFSKFDKAHAAAVLAAIGPVLVTVGIPEEAAAGLIAVLAWAMTWAIPNAE